VTRLHGDPYASVCVTLIRWPGRSGALSSTAFMTAVAVLGAAGMQMRPIGIALWAAVALHAAMTAWCVASVVRKSGGATTARGV